MCGIAGLIHPAASRLIGEMVTAQRHRGPDAEGTWHGPGISLGHNRLSIIDLSDAGRQPMLAMDDGHTAVSDADAPADRVVAALVFNGEIYNYRELRDEIAAAGQMFRSDSDTEVLLHGLRRHGPAFLQRCVGMFALALFEPRTGVLLLARDRMGKKPLAVARVMIDGEPGIAFASELSAFSALARALPDGAGLAIDPTAVLGYLLNDYVPPPRTILRHCWRVPAGHRLELPIDRLRELPMDGPLPTTAWWRRVFTPKHALSKADAEAQYEELFTDAVRMRLRSDVPLGVFLSGGIDSSLVVATTRKLLPGPLHTFNLRFREASFDESPWARTVAQHFDTVHHETELSVDDLFHDVPAMLDHMDEPFADHSLLPTRAVSRMARQQVTVVLGGDGADEPFAGYAPFGAWPIARWLAVAPPWMWRLVARMRLVPGGDGYLALDFRIAHFLQGLLVPAERRHSAWMAPTTPQRLAAITREWSQSLLGGEGEAGAWETAASAFRHAGRGNDVSMLDRQIHAWMSSYLTEDILTKVDRASMAVGLEARSPFLDHRVLDFTLRLPDRERFSHSTLGATGTGKVLLRRIGRRMLPAGVVGRRKQGFAIPLAAWLRGPLREQVQSTLLGRAAHDGGWFDRSMVRELIDDHGARRRNYQKLLWALFVFEAWRQRHPEIASCAPGDSRNGAAL